MKIDDFEIIVKKYDKEKSCVIVNLLVFKVLEIRGFTVRCLTTKSSPTIPVYMVCPPSVKAGKGWFWIVKFSDTALWQQLKEWMKCEAKKHVNSLPQI
jgi:hypothetical protein